MSKESKFEQDVSAAKQSSQEKVTYVQNPDLFIQNQIDSGGLIQFLLILSPAKISSLNRLRKYENIIDVKWKIYYDPLRLLLLYYFTKDDEPEFARRTLRTVLRNSAFYIGLILAVILWRMFGS